MESVIKWRIACLLLCIIFQTHRVSTSQEVMKKLTAGFGKALEQCKTELNLGDHIIQDFYNYWKEDYELLNRDTGCAIKCMAAKFDLITDDNQMHHKNAHEFAKNHGADDDVAKQLVDMIHGCEKTHAAVTDDCLKILEVSKCFRTKIHELKWAPSMEEIIEELMTEV